MKENTKMEKGEVRFASGKKFVQSMRHQGLTDEDAIKEFLDNSFDANADNVWINIWENNDDLYVSIQDDGDGMDKELLGKATAFGETNNEDGGDKIGRFGFGMTTAIVSKTKFADVFSKKRNGEYNYILVNLEELEKDLRLYKPFAKKPQDVYDKVKTVESGTFIVLKHCDRFDYKKPKTVEKHLQEDLGEVYRYFLNKGKNIYINDTPVEVIDPLMTLKNHKYHEDLIKGLKSKDVTDDTGYSNVYDLDPIPIDYFDEEGNKKTGYVRVKLALLPIRDIWRTAESYDKRWKKYRISEMTQGFYIVRNDRQISGAELMFMKGLKRHPSLNYFRGEIDFDSVLDDEFDVQVNKNRFSPSRQIRDKIKNAVWPIIQTIRRERNKITSELSSKQEKDKQVAEEIAKDAPYKTLKKVKEAKEEEIKKAEEKEIKKIEKDKDLSEQVKQDKIKSVKETLEKQLPYTVDTEHSRQGPIFSWEYLGKTTKVILNREHPFYKYYWEASKNNTYFRTMLKILIFTMVKGEQIHQEELEEGHVLTFQELHNHWNMILRKFLNSNKFISFATEEFPEVEGYQDVEIEE